MEKILQALRSPQRLVVTSHTNPDGDAVGASLALTILLQKMGHEVICFNSDPIPDLYQFLPGSGMWKTKLPAGQRFDATLVIDVADLKRTGLCDVARDILGKIIVLDHHVTQEKFGDLQYIDSGAGAAGILVYRLAKAAHVAIDLDLAKNIYCCILTDTGSFRYSSANPEAFAIASELVAIGVESWSFASQIYENQPLRRLQLLARVLQSLEVSANGQVATIEVSQKTLREFDAGADLTDGFINYPRSIADVEVAIFFRDTDDGKLKASMRSSGRVDVAEICRQFGGGGHRNAAGCTLEGNLEELKRKLIDLTSKTCEKDFRKSMNGILVLDKPVGPTSAFLSRKLSQALGGIKMGHCGTLDPMASGVLPLCLGEATKISQYLMLENKIYQATFELGAVTNTYDAAGERSDEKDLHGLTTAAIEKALDSYRGNFLQIPPAFSAKKVEGVRSYALARRGEKVDLKPAPVHISNLKILAFEAPLLRVLIQCSKGTYVRSLAHDLGQTLGCGGFVRELRRLQHGNFKLAESISWQSLEEQLTHPVNLRTLVEDHLLSTSASLEHFRGVTISDARQITGVLGGKTLQASWIQELFDQEEGASQGHREVIKVLDVQARLLALVERSAPATFKYLRVFNEI